MVDLVLIGGGHAHALFIKMWAMKALPGVRVTLISEGAITPYSGMIPGYMVGCYSQDDIHIDLVRLCSFAQVRFILDQVVSLDLDKNRIKLKSTSDLSFDVLSINIGSQPLKPAHFSSKVTPIKPIANFLSTFDRIVNSGGKPKLAVVGAGASGVEVAKNLALRIPNGKVTLIHASHQILPAFSEVVRSYLQEELDAISVEVIFDKKIEHEEDGTLQVGDWTRTFDHIFWTISPGPQGWIKDSGIKVDQAGFMLVSPSLQSLSHSYVFAAGDIASVDGYHLAKSGVYAVRGAKILFQNICSFLQGKPLASWAPNLEPLALIGIGGRYAVASKGRFGAKSPLLWKLKDYIDRKFMAQFENLTPMSKMVPCGGCAAKVSPLALCGFLDRKIENGVSEEDASFLQLGSQSYVVSIDRLTSIVSDPYVFGEIAVNHCLNDIYAVGGDAQYIQIVAELPRSTESLHQRDLERLTSGIRAQCLKENVSLVGGHSGLSDELGLTISVIGETKRKSSKKVSSKLGDLLILTKPLGTGLIFSGLMQQKSTAKMVESTIHSMRLSNRAWANLFRTLGIHAVTDVSGFGFLGHLLEILSPNLAAVLQDHKIPRFEGVDNLIKSGIKSTAFPQNSVFLPYLLNSVQSQSFELLCDPQTSGGLLAAVSENQFEDLNQSAKGLGIMPCIALGKIIERHQYAVELRP